MYSGKHIRLSRLFSHESERFCSVAIDHFFGYQEGLPNGLIDLPATLTALVKGRPDAITMQNGVAYSCAAIYGGKIPMILQSTVAHPDDRGNATFATPEDAVRMGADAYALACFLRGKTEAAFLERAANQIREARKWEMPVIGHFYSRKYDRDGKVEITYKPEEIAWCIRCAVELGVDVIKVPFTGDVESYRDLIRITPLPIVAAGGPKAATLKEALTLASMVRQAGAKGMTIGRNIWGFPQITEAVLAFKGVIHDGMTPSQAMEKAGIRE